MLKVQKGKYEIHQNLINYMVQVVSDKDILKEFNPRRWISMEEAEKIINEEVEIYESKSKR